MSGVTRCPWAGDDPLLVAYHDDEWGVPLHDDRALFELLVLEGAQAGLSWITILRKREGYRRAFDGFDARKIARYDARKVKRLLADEGIVRNRLKIASVIGNARALLAVQEEHGSFDAFLWRFAPGASGRRAPRSVRDLPARTAASDAMSAELRRRGFGFVGGAICYAFMQAAGMVNDHLAGCFRRAAASRVTRR